MDTLIFKNFCNLSDPKNLQNELKLKYKLNNVRSSSNNQIKVEIAETGMPLIIQTPILNCPFGVSNGTKNEQSLSARNIVANLYPSGEFYDFLIRLDKQIKESLEKNMNLFENEKNSMNLFENEKNSMNLVENDKNSMNLFENEKNSMNLFENVSNNHKDSSNVESSINFLGNVRSYSDYHTFRMNFDYQYNEPLFDLFEITVNNEIQRIESNFSSPNYHSFKTHSLNELILPKDRFTAIIELSFIAFYKNKQGKITFYCHWRILKFERIFKFTFES
jgi:hypothetical protein